MRVLICSNIYPPKFIGGAEIIAHNQATTLKNIGHDVRVFAGDIREIGEPHCLYSEHYDEIDVRRVRLTHRDFVAENNNFSNPEAEDHFSSVMDEFKPDVVHCHNLAGLSINIPILAKNFGAATVVTLHDHWGYCFKNTAEKKAGEICADHRDCKSCMPTIGIGSGKEIPIQVRMNYFKYVMSYFDVFISPSQYLADKYVQAGFPKDKMNVLWNGIDVERFPRSNKQKDDLPVEIAFFGYFGRHKGIEVLLKAVAMAKSRSSIRLNLIGEGDRESAYRQIISEAGLEKSVKFWGKVDNSRIAEFYDFVDVLILPSIWPENQPVSITEAMASGIPVIATDVGGMPELVVNEETGLTFPLGDVNALARCLDRLVGDAAMRARFGANGRRLIQQFSFAKQVTKLEKMYADARKVSPRSKPDIVAILGSKAEADFEDGVRLFDELYPDLRCGVGMSEWLIDDDLTRAIAACIMDPTPKQVEHDEVNDFRELGLPVLMPSPLANDQGRVWGDFAYASPEELTGLIAYISKSIGKSENV
jgi:glycosyltransferase involved in cell wall biosynthesis